jgi:hypothetical protein
VEDGDQLAAEAVARSAAEALLQEAGDYRRPPPAVVPGRAPATVLARRTQHRIPLRRRQP